MESELKFFISANMFKTVNYLCLNGSNVNLLFFEELINNVI